ncbi:hypothetical protein LPB86_01345 [Pedobacter sp. MC2016-14]|uniref:hypothetical protein n=1 Tax=Pedobacter sp. MC2016-14 TaxID=2897327 RepID=UPI001E32D1C1|nr:hypothetical protein [Pedobacter sp. MC2016-14]MCD0486853.1 hypothetical protein [Pedobacter sp. MC2016-14]
MKRKSIKLLKIILLSTIILILITEISLRWIMGLDNAVLYRRDKDFEYIPIPQEVVRFGKRNFYNAYSQRNDNITSKDSIIIAGFGDSVINGGTLSDQDSLATTKLTKSLSKKYKKPVKVLNIAAGSWGPDNCFAYLKRYGDFKCQKILLVVSSHDAFDNMTFENPNQIDPRHPEEQYKLAVIEVLYRYILPKIFGKHRTSTTEPFFINKRTKSTPFNPGFNSFYNYCKNKNLPFIVYLHSDTSEAKRGKYNEQGQIIINFCKNHNIDLVKELDYNIPIDSCYRDPIHFNDHGQQKMFEILESKL